MKTEQFVMAYGVEQDRLRAILPYGFVSLRPVLRINAETIDNKQAYLEFNTAEENAIKILCEQVLGTYVVEFEREEV